MKDNATLPRTDVLKHTVTVREVAITCKVSHQRVLQIIKSKKLEERGIAKKYGSQWMLIPEVIDIINATKGKVGNPNMVKGRPNIYKEKIQESRRKYGWKTGPMKQPNNLPTKKKEKKPVLDHNPHINTKVKRRSENGGKSSIFMDED
jgi:hypothetical protein